MRVGLIDDGVYVDNEIEKNIRFTGEILPEGKEVIEQITKNTPYSHGTICAKIMIKQFFDIEIFSIKILKEETLTANIDQLAIAIKWCIDNEISLINLSLGSVNSIEFEKIERIMWHAHTKGIIIVAAFNNNNTFTMPASLPFVIGVKSSKRRKSKIKKVKKSLVGESIIESSRYSIIIENKEYITPKCNSFAAPAVTGKICKFLCLTCHNTKNKSVLGEKIRHIKSSIPQYNDFFLYRTNWVQKVQLRDVLKRKNNVPIIEFCGNEAILRAIFLELIGENIFPLFVKDYQRNKCTEFFFGIIAGRFDCDLIFIRKKYLKSKFVDMRISAKDVIEIEYRNKTYVNKSVDEGCKMLINLLN